MILYRPVGLQELELIYDSGMRAFPARLPQQPIFYPVLDLEYARQIASDWNASSGQQAGYVTQFKVEDEYIRKFEEHTVGGSQHQELWIPAEEMEEFNRHITGTIKVVEAHFGETFEGFVPDQFGLQGKDAVAQFTLLANSFVYRRLEFYQEIKRNHKAVFLDYPFWLTHEFKNEGLKEKVLQGIKEAWFSSFPKIPLPSPVPKDDTPEAEVDSQPLENPVPEGRTDSFSWDEEDIEEETPPVKQSPSFVNPVRKESAPEEQINRQEATKPGRETITPPQGSASHFVAKPAPRETVPVRQPESFFVQGVQLGLREQYKEAVEQLSRAVAVNPRQVAAQTSLGVARLRLGEENRALSCYEAAIKIDPRSAEAHYFRANILYARGEVREAVEEYTIAIGLKPELIEAHENPLPQDRLTDYNKSPAGMNRIARPARRILELNQLLEANPRQPEILKERAAEYSRLWNDEQAIADYSASLKIRPDDARVLHLRGQAYERIGQSERALDDFRQATNLNPQLSNEYLNQGVQLGRIGNYRQSIASLTEGIRLAPRNPNGYFNRGTSYFQLGDLENAIADFSTVIELTSNDEDAYYWRGISYEEAGRQKEAIADYRQLLAISQNPDLRAEIRQRLSQWNEEDPKETSQRRTPEDQRKSDPTKTKERDQKLDLYELVSALGERALRSTWFGSDLDCEGEKADELYESTDQNQPVDGGDFLEITSGIQRTVKGDFQAFDRGGESPWLFVRAWKGEGFYIETNDPKIKARLKSQFPSLEEVQGAAAPYLGMFIPI